MTQGWKCQVTDSLARDGWEIYLLNHRPNGTVDALSNFTLYHSEKGTSYVPPVVDREFLQAIMDGLWHGGFRPTGVTDVRESTAALKDHLNDMRVIVGSKLGVKLP